MDKASLRNDPALHAVGQSPHSILNLGLQAEGPQ